MNLKCSRCNNPLGDNYQLIFDEIGVEMQLDKLLEEHFAIYIKKDSNPSDALCTNCVNKLIELYDLTQKKQELLLLPKTTEVVAEPFIEEQELIIEPLILDTKKEDVEMVTEQTLKHDDEEMNAELTVFENVQYLDEMEGNTTQEYIRKVIKSELQEITFDRNTVCRICEEVLKSHTAVLMHVATSHETPSKTYPCIICDKLEEFKSIKDLAYHVVLKHYDLELITIYCMCPECGKRFSSFVEYNKHSCYKKSTGSRLLDECVTCAKKFISNKRYRFHLQFHLERRRPKACFICDILFSDENDLYEHIMYAHEKDVALICQKCDCVCTSKKLYDNHRKLHNAIRSYHCKHCSRSYLYKQMLMDHIEAHHFQNEYNKCKICKKTLVSKHLLKRHMQIRHSEETVQNVYECSECGLVGASEEDTQCHMDENLCGDAKLIKEPLKIAYACEFCELAYKSVETLKTHRKTHKKNSYTCWICDNPYTEYKNLKTHISTHHEYDPIQTTFPINRHYVCDIESCDQSYLTWPSLRSHKVRHASDAKYKCEVCPETFRYRPHLNAHLKAHSNNEEYHCQFCSKICFSQMSLAVHVARRHNNNLVACPTCQACYQTEEALQEHINAHHVELKCEHCGKTTKNRRNLEIHIRMVHSQMKRFFCKLCNKGYYNKSDLIVHERASHLELDMFKCQHCDFRTSYKDSIDAHILLHSSKKPFKCDECSKEFTRKTCFKLHLLRHADVRPFACPVENCDKSFVTRGILNTHLRVTHPDHKILIKRASPRSAKQKEYYIEESPASTSPTKSVIMNDETDNAVLKIKEEEEDIEFLDESNGGQEIVLDCTDESTDLIVDLNESEINNEYPLDQV